MASMVDGSNHLLHELMNVTLSHLNALAVYPSKLLLNASIASSYRYLRVYGTPSPIGLVCVFYLPTHMREKPTCLKVPSVQDSVMDLSGCRSDGKLTSFAGSIHHDEICHYYGAIVCLSAVGLCPASRCALALWFCSMSFLQALMLCRIEACCAVRSTVFINTLPSLSLMLMTVLASAVAINRCGTSAPNAYSSCGKCHLLTVACLSDLELFVVVAFVMFLVQKTVVCMIDARYKVPLPHRNTHIYWASCASAILSCS